MFFEKLNEIVNNYPTSQYNGLWHTILVYKAWSVYCLYGIQFKKDSEGLASKII